ncbi:MAG: helix-turn-helix domain-containing protein [Mariniphaga sp.]|nr:helix-turn-helix domain-containing protein [Mariniphaga sp.]
METNKQLNLAFDFVQYTNQNIFLTGKAGTGKTTFLLDLKKKLPKRMVVVAPTGVAAINAGGITIHSFFQLSFGPQIGNENLSPQQLRFSKNKINIIRSLDLLVIDEISMVRADMLDAIDRVLRRFRDRNKPFGGAQVLMIGDLQQLSPVVKNDEWNLLKSHYETIYFFSSKVLRETQFVSIELVHVFRQQDNKFISILNKVRDNQLDQKSLDLLNQRYIPNFKPDTDKGFITLCTHNAHAQRINDSKLKQLLSNEEVFNATVEGNFPEYSFPTEFKLKLKVGAQVMFIKNDPSPEKLFYNGKIGKITSIDEDGIYVLCSKEESVIEVTPLVWENIKYSINKETAEIKESVEGEFRQFPLKLAWAITIHKSQGLTFERAIIDAEASFAHGQVYVALSRCKTLEGMVLSTPISNRSIINDGTVSGFIQDVEQNQPNDKKLNDAKYAYQQELLTELFNFNLTKMLVNTINKLMRENSSSIPTELVDFFKQIRNEMTTGLVDIAEKFQAQIIQFLAPEPNIEQNTKLLERISKAAIYFGEKVKTIIIENVAKADLEIDNKVLRKQINSTASRLIEDAELKIAGYKICESGFQVKKLLDARAKALIEISSSTPKKRKVKEILNSDSIPHPELYNTLRIWRIEKTKELGVPSYMVFSQKALIELVNYLPVELDTLNQINGLGSKKVSQFGKDIIEIVQEYCQKNNVDRVKIPLKDMPGKTTKPKVDTKKLSFELYILGKNINEIAAERNLTQTTIAGHLAYYVGKGELDVNLFLEKDTLEKIIQYFKTTKTKDLGPAKNALGNDVSFSDLRFGLSYLESLSKNGLRS